VDANVLKQYTKTKRNKHNKLRSYQVLKLKAEDGFEFYSSVNLKFLPSVGKKLRLNISTKKVNFYNFLFGFYASSKILTIYKEQTLKERLNRFIAYQHKDQNISKLYQALYTATALPSELQKVFSSLGVSHLIAISGFHLGVLSALIFFLFKYPYTFLQNRYFPYRSYHRDSFILVSFILLGYLLFLGSPPSLLRAFSMLVVGFVLYDRGVEIISMQTLLLTVLSLLALFPNLLLSIGFWLSVSGVFYIFLFLLHFKTMDKVKQFIFIPFWVYFFMLPYSLVIFGNFSVYHPLSIVWTSLFTLFYPLSIVLHLLGYGALLDPLIDNFISLYSKDTLVSISTIFLVTHILFSLLAVYNKWGIYLLWLNAAGVFFLALKQLF
jgi:competence protein ComEC